MAKQLNEAYVVSAVRTPVGKAPRGMFNQTRPDDLLAHALKGLLDVTWPMTSSVLVRGESWRHEGCHRAGST